MSTLSTKVVEIDEILPFPDPNTHSLELAKIKGWIVVVGKNSYAKGDKVVYIEPDSVIPKNLEDKLWENSKIARPKDGRIRAIKIRGVISPGLIASLDVCGLDPNTQINTEVSNKLGITKYTQPTNTKTNKNLEKSFKRPHLDFSKYTDIENFKRNLDVLNEGEQVYVTLKLHGTSCRFGWAKSVVEDFRPIVEISKSGLKFNLKDNLRCIKQRVLKLLNKLPEYEFVIGSRNLEIYKDTKTYYKENVWEKVAMQYKDKLGPGEFLFGEIVGKGIQQNFDYGFNDPTFFAYDFKVDGEWLNYDKFIDLCENRNIPTVPILYTGPYSFDKVEQLRNSEDHDLDKNVPCREGVVIRPVNERVSPYLGRVILKAISDKYYLAKTTEYQ